MTSSIDTYLESATDDQLARANEIRSIVHNKFGNDIEECISYNMPGFRLKTHGKIVLGFALNKNAIGVYPHSGNVLQRMKRNLSSHQTAKSALNFPLTSPIPSKIIVELLDIRQAEILGST